MVIETYMNIRDEYFMNHVAIYHNNIIIALVMTSQFRETINVHIDIKEN